MSKQYNNINARDSLLNRLNYIFNEFEQVIVSVSVGKDSVLLVQEVNNVAKNRKSLN